MHFKRHFVKILFSYSSTRVQCVLCFMQVLLDCDSLEYVGGACMCVGWMCACCADDISTAMQH